MEMKGIESDMRMKWHGMAGGRKGVAWCVMLAAALVASCGSSRRAVRPEVGPVAGGVVPVQVVEPSKGKVKELTPAERLAWRLDSLLTAQDSLLQTSQLGLHIVDLTAGVVLYARGEHQRMRPASTEKVVTAVCALDALGPGYTLDTRLMATGEVNGGVLKGDLYVRGAMDPLLTQADVARMAKISQPSYNAIEQGKSTPKPDTAKRIASALEFKWTRFYEEDEQ